MASRHPVLEAIQPLVAAIGGVLVAPGDLEPADVPIVWEGRIIAGVRAMSLEGALERMVSRIEQELGRSLADLDRVSKQRAVRMLDERGAFLLRRSIEDIADLMGVSRITIYNYLGAIRDT